MLARSISMSSRNTVKLKSTGISKSEKSITPRSSKERGYACKSDSDYISLLEGVYKIQDVVERSWGKVKVERGALHVRLELRFSGRPANPVRLMLRLSTFYGDHSADLYEFFF